MHFRYSLPQKLMKKRIQKGIRGTDVGKSPALLEFWAFSHRDDVLISTTYYCTQKSINFWSIFNQFYNLHELLNLTITPLNVSEWIKKLYLECTWPFLVISQVDYKKFIKRGFETKFIFYDKNKNLREDVIFVYNRKWLFTMIEIWSVI